MVLLPPQGAVPGGTVGERGLIEEHLIALNTAHPSRLGVIVVVPEALQALKKRRSGSLPDGVTYDANSFGGRCAGFLVSLCTKQMSYVCPAHGRLPTSLNGSPALQGGVSAIRPH